MAYSVIPGVDEEYNFPPKVQEAYLKYVTENLSLMKTAVTSGDLNTVTTPGFYPIAGLDIGNSPENLYGTLEVTAPTGGRILQTFTTAANSPKIYTRFFASGTWQAWVRTDGNAMYKGIPTDGTDFNTFITDGVWGIANATGTVTAPNSPSAFTGILEVFRLGVAVIQRYTTTTSPTLVFARRGNSNGTFLPWSRLDNEELSKKLPDSGISKKELLRRDLTNRKGGRIGVRGKGVICLRFDDAPSDFVSKILPLLKDRKLPFTRVSTSYSIYDEVLPAGTFSQMEAYCLENGGEVWNHGRTHKEVANTKSELENEVLGSLETLRAQMPKLVIDCFAPPGDSYSWGGYLPAKTMDSWVTNEMGQIIYLNHALASGYFDSGLLRVMDGTLKDGDRSYSSDGYTASVAKNTADIAIAGNLGAVFMYHSNKVNVAELAPFLDYLVQKRDEGVLEVLTMSGLGLADSSTDYRRSVLRGTGGTNFEETITQLDRRGDVRGATLMLVGDVRASAGSTVTTTIGDYSKTHLVPSSGLVKIYHPITVPADILTIKVSITGVSSNVKLQAV